MQVEITRTMVPSKGSSSLKAGETINTKIQRRDYLLKQSQLTANWVQDFKSIWNQDQLTQIAGDTSTWHQSANVSVDDGSATKARKHALSIPFALNAANRMSKRSSIDSNYFDPQDSMQNDDMFINEN